MDERCALDVRMHPLSWNSYQCIYFNKHASAGNPRDHYPNISEMYWMVEDAKALHDFEKKPEANLVCSKQKANG